MPGKPISIEAVETTALERVEAPGFDLASTDPIGAFERARQVVEHMSAQCTGPQFIARISGRNYPKVEWWTTVGSALGLFPVEITSVKTEHRDGGYQYEAVVEVRHSGQTVTRASAICSTQEKAWGDRDEYAVKSMATTRATGKAYRIGLSSLAVMAGLEATPADEIPPGGFPDRLPPSTGEYGICPIHNVPFFKRGQMRTPAHRDGDGWCNKPRPQTGVSDPVLGKARAAGVEALSRIAADAETQKRWVAENLPRLAGISLADYTLEDWSGVIELAEAERRVSNGQDTTATPPASEQPVTSADLPWDVEETSDA